MSKERPSAPAPWNTGNKTALFVPRGSSRSRNPLPEPAPSGPNILRDLLISAVIRIFRRPVWAQRLYHIHFFCRSVKIQIHIYRPHPLRLSPRPQTPGKRNTPRSRQDTESKNRQENLGFIEAFMSSHFLHSFSLFTLRLLSFSAGIPAGGRLRFPLSPPTPRSPPLP